MAVTEFGGGDDAGVTGEGEDVDEDDVFHGDVAAVADGEAVVGLAAGDGVADVGEAEPLGVELAADVFEGLEGGGAGDEVGGVVSGDLFGAVGVAIDVVGIGAGIVVGDGAELGGGVDGEEAVDGVVGGGGAVFDAGIELDGGGGGGGEGVGVAPAEKGAAGGVVVGEDFEGGGGVGGGGAVVGGAEGEGAGEVVDTSGEEAHHGGVDHGDVGEPGGEGFDAVADGVSGEGGPPVIMVVSTWGTVVGLTRVMLIQELKALMTWAQL